MTYRLGVDVGGTFTDVVLYDSDAQRVWLAKTPSTPGDQSVGVIEGIRLAAERASVGLPELEANLSRRAHRSLLTRIHHRFLIAPATIEDTAGYVRFRLTAAGTEETVIAKTGLRLDPYFSATKVAWILDHVAGARAKAERGELAFGTVETFLLWRLTGGRVHATDATNASRTCLFDIHTGAWDEALLDLFRVPRALLGLGAALQLDLNTREALHQGAREALTAALAELVGVAYAGLARAAAGGRPDAVRTLAAATPNKSASGLVGAYQIGRAHV